MDSQKVIKNFKALYVTNEIIIGARGYYIYEFNLKHNTFKKKFKVIDAKYSLLSLFKLSRRIFRAEITNFYRLDNDIDFLIAKKAIYKREQKSSEFRKCLNLKRGSKPLNLCITPENKIYFGEYFSNVKKDEVYIYCSNNLGRSWDIAYTFQSGEINHIHGIFYDKYTDYIWFCTGDLNNECKIGYTQNHFKTITILFEGNQNFRTCNLFFYKDYVIFATDSQYIINNIFYFNREQKKAIPIKEIQGSSIKGSQNSQFSILSTTVEPSKINTDKFSYVWYSNNGLEWKQIIKLKKDSLPHYFQFGCVEFPKFDNKYNINKIVISGRALKNYDNKTLIIDLL